MDDEEEEERDLRRRDAESDTKPLDDNALVQQEDEYAAQADGDAPIDDSTPERLRAGYRSISTIAIIAVFALLGVVGLIGVVLAIHGAQQRAVAPTVPAAPIFSPAPGESAVANPLALAPYSSGNGVPRPIHQTTSGSSGFVFGAAGNAGTNTTAGDLNYRCPPNYHLAAAPGKSTPICDADTTMLGTPNAPPVGGTVGGAAGAPRAESTPTPLPPQLLSFATPSGGDSAAQNAQAQRDLAAAPSVTPPPQPQPVYADGRLVGYVYPPATPMYASTVSAPVAVSTPAPAAPSQFVYPAPTSATASAPTIATASAPTSATTSATVGYVTPETRDQIDAGTVIPFSLVSSIDSDLPGTFLAQVAANVYDSRTHRHIVIPVGTLATFAYSSRVVAGQSRLLAGATELRFADGREFRLGNQSAIDALGSAGLVGRVDKHPGPVLNDALLLTVLAAANAALSPQQGASALSAPSLGSQIQAAAGAQLSNIGDRLIGSAIARPPTIRIVPPYQFAVLVVHDLPLDRYAVPPQVARLIPYRAVAAPIATPATPVPSQFCCRRRERRR